VLDRCSQVGAVLQKPGEQTSGYSDGIALFLRAWDWARSSSFRPLFCPGAATCFNAKVFFMRIPDDVYRYVNLGI